MSGPVFQWQPKCGCGEVLMTVRLSPDRRMPIERMTTAWEQHRGMYTCVACEREHRAVVAETTLEQNVGLRKRPTGVTPKGRVVFGYHETDVQGPGVVVPWRTTLEDRTRPLIGTIEAHGDDRYTLEGLYTEDHQQVRHPKGPLVAAANKWGFRFWLPAVNGVGRFTRCEDASGAPHVVPEGEEHTIALVNHGHAQRPGVHLRIGVRRLHLDDEPEIHADEFKAWHANKTATAHDVKRWRHERRRASVLVLKDKEKT